MHKKPKMLQKCYNKLILQNALKSKGGASKDTFHLQPSTKYVETRVNLQKKIHFKRCIKYLRSPFSNVDSSFFCDQRASSLNKQFKKFQNSKIDLR